VTIETAVGILLLLGGPLVVAGLLFVMPAARRPLLGLLAFSTCHIQRPWFKDLFFVPYRGVDRGFGVTIPDLLFLGLGIYLVISRSYVRGWRPPNRWPYRALVAVAAIGLLPALHPSYGMFTLWKLVRAGVLYTVVAHVLRSRRDVRALILGLAAAVAFQGATVLLDKYVTGRVVYRALGSFPHPNSLAGYVNMLLPVLLALLLLRRDGWRGWLGTTALALGAVAVLFTRSRMGLLLMIGALGITGLLALGRGFSPRRLVIASAALLVATVVGIFAAPSVIRRFESAPKESAETRAHFNAAAKSMANNRIFGVGLNGFCWAITNVDEYYWLVYEDKREVDDPEEFRASHVGSLRLGTVHSTYYLFASETGWVGMGFFVIWIARNLWIVCRAAVRARDPFDKSVMQGIAVGFVTLHIQGFVEWVLPQVQVLFLFMILSGTVAALDRGLVSPAARRACSHRRRLEPALATN